MYLCHVSAFVMHVFVVILVKHNDVLEQNVHTNFLIHFVINMRSIWIMSKGSKERPQLIDSNSQITGQQL